MAQLTRTQIGDFREILWGCFEAHRRDMPWRVPEPDGNFDAYKILVSEMMLQQTQVARVVPKFTEFVAKFPALEDLAAASLGDVLKAWQGLGYNRRAKFLHAAAQALISKEAPWKREDLVVLTGIGPNTAGAILAYAYNQPVTFIETNIRTVFIHHFFQDQTGVSDADIRPLIEQTLDYNKPREWFWALMDYGAFLKSTVGNVNTSSKNYAKQSKFSGSRRQIRGHVIRLLADKAQTLAELQIQITDERLESVLADLCQEKLIHRAADRYQLA